MSRRKKKKKFEMEAEVGDSLKKTLIEAGIVEEGSETSPLEALMKMQEEQMKKLKESGILEGLSEAPSEPTKEKQKASLPSDELTSDPSESVNEKIKAGLLSGEITFKDSSKQPLPDKERTVLTQQFNEKLKDFENCGQQIDELSRNYQSQTEEFIRIWSPKAADLLVELQAKTEEILMEQTPEANIVETLEKQLQQIIEALKNVEEIKIPLEQLKKTEGLEKQFKDQQSTLENLFKQQEQISEKILELLKK